MCRYIYVTNIGARDELLDDGEYQLKNKKRQAVWGVAGTKVTLAVLAWSGQGRICNQVPEGNSEIHHASISSCSLHNKFLGLDEAVLYNSSPYPPDGQNNYIKSCF
jgi:hypothetical protein